MRPNKIDAAEPGCQLVSGGDERTHAAHEQYMGKSKKSDRIINHSVSWPAAFERRGQTSEGHVTDDSDVECCCVDQAACRHTGNQFVMMTNKVSSGQSRHENGGDAKHARSPQAHLQPAPGNRPLAYWLSACQTARESRDLPNASNPNKKSSCFARLWILTFPGTIVMFQCVMVSRWFQCKNFHMSFDSIFVPLWFALFNFIWLCSFKRTSLENWVCFCASF